MEFIKLWESIFHEEGSKAIKAIRIGNNIDVNFWDFMLRMCNNAEDFSALLDVRPEDVYRWSANIRKYREEAKREIINSMQNVETKVLKTGKLNNWS